MEVKQGPNFPKQIHIAGACRKTGVRRGRCESDSKILAGAKGESKEQLHQIRLYLERKLRSMDDRQNLYLCFPSEPVSVSDDFSSVPFTFVPISGFSLTPDSSGYVGNFAEICLAKNEIAITVLSIFLTPR